MGVHAYGSKVGIILICINRSVIKVLGCGTVDSTTHLTPELKLIFSRVEKIMTCSLSGQKGLEITILCPKCTFTAQKNKAFKYSVKFCCSAIDLSVTDHDSEQHKGGLVASLCVIVVLGSGSSLNILLHLSTIFGYTPPFHASEEFDWDCSWFVRAQDSEHTFRIWITTYAHCLWPKTEEITTWPC